jgi:hypothetical protein
MSGRGGFSRVLLVTVVVTLAALALTAGAGAAKHKPKKPKAAAPVTFCSNPIVDDYRAPLEAMGPIPAPPEDGVLPFAPAGTTLSATGPQGVLVGGSSVGFRLTNSAPAEANAPHLGWTVLERLIRFTNKGQNLHPSGLKRIDLAQLQPGKHRGLTFPLPATPAIYSVEVTIQTHRGRLLGRYGEYIRVVGRTVNTSITLSVYDNVVPGGYIESCFENHGTAQVTPTGTSLERLVGTTWRPVVVGPQYSPAQTAIQRTLGPGEAERIGTLVPPNAFPGLYKLNATGTTELGEPVALNAEFGVL